MMSDPEKPKQPELSPEQLKEAKLKLHDLQGKLLKEEPLSNEEIKAIQNLLEIKTPPPAEKLPPETVATLPTETVEKTTTETAADIESATLQKERIINKLFLTTNHGFTSETKKLLSIADIEELEAKLLQIIEETKALVNEKTQEANLNDEDEEYILDESGPGYVFKYCKQLENLVRNRESFVKENSEYTWKDQIAEKLNWIYGPFVKKDTEKAIEYAQNQRKVTEAWNNAYGTIMKEVQNDPRAKELSRYERDNYVEEKFAGKFWETLEANLQGELNLKHDRVFGEIDIPQTDRDKQYSIVIFNPFCSSGVDFTFQELFSGSSKEKVSPQPKHFRLKRPAIVKTTTMENIALGVAHMWGQGEVEK